MPVRERSAGNLLYLRAYSPPPRRDEEPPRRTPDCPRTRVRLGGYLAVARVVAVQVARGAGTERTSTQHQRIDPVCREDQ